MNPDPRDEELLRRFLAGDQAAFAELMGRHEDKIFSLAFRMTGDRADALDATQDAFIAAFKKARAFRGESAFSTWLYRIAVNACNDLLRKKKRYVLVEDPAGEHLAASGTDVATSASARIDVQRALASLQPDYREAVALHDLGGLRYEEIASVTGAQLGTVKSRISRGRKQLAELLEQRDDLAPSKEVT
ncbi:MAG: RNA polymerase sigma factor [Actinomycetota bacterium]